MSQKRKSMSAIIAFAQVCVLGAIIAISHGGAGAGATGSLAITGIVTDSSDNGIGGISVTADAPGTTTVDFGPATTATDGSYTLDVAAGTYDFHFDPPSGSSLKPIVDSNVTVLNDQTINVQLIPLNYTFSGTVTNAVGTPVANAQVSFIQSGNTKGSTTTDVNGNFSQSLPPGTYEVQVMEGGDAILQDGFDLTSGNLTQNFVLPTTGSLTVTVKDSNGNPLTSVTKGGYTFPVNVSVSGSQSVQLISGMSQATESVSGSGNVDSTGTTTISGLFTGIGVNVCVGYSGGSISGQLFCASSPVTVSSGNTTIVLQQEPPAPSTPTNLTASSPTQYPSLSWTTVSGATSYNIYRNGTKVDSTTSATYTDNTAPEGTDSYFVTAVNSAGESGQSNTVSVLVDRTAPNITYSVTQTNGQPANNSWYTSPATVTFACTDNTGGSGIASYSSPQTESTDGQYTLTGTCTDNAGNVASVNVTVNIDQTAPIAGTPTWSANPVVTGNNTTVTLPVSDNLSGVSAGEYYIGNTDPGQGNGTAMTYNQSTSTLTATFGSGLTPGTYSINLRAQDTAGNWSTVTAVTLTVNPPIPSAPTNLSAVSPTQTPNLSWAGSIYATSYNIYRNGAKIGSTTSTSYTDSTATNGTYSYYVTAGDVSGESSPSNTISVIVNTTPPTTTASLSPNPFSDGSYANPVAVTLSATASSGVSVTNTYYTVDGGSQQTYTSPFTVSGYGDHTITYWSTDSSGLTETANTKTFHIDQPPVIASIPNATINEGSTFTQSDSFTDPDSSSWTATVDYGDGSGSQPLSLSGTSFSLSHVYADEGTYTAQVTVTDSDGVSSSTTATVTVNNAPFTVNAITGIPTSPILTNSSGTATVNASAVFDDPGTSDTHTATWSWGDGSAPTTGTVSESNGSGTAAGSHMYTSAGVYVVTLTVTDDDGMSVTQTFQYASVENPSVPGSRFGAGVKFNSPAGADVASPSLTGEVKFAIQVWFTQGAIDSNSKVDMNFVAGNIDFKSTSVTEFISSNGLGTVTGTGTINGTGNYTFLVTGINSANPGGNTVRFQIKDASGNVVYDTQPGAADNVAPTTQITAGQVTVQ